MNKIYVGNLPYSTTDSSLSEAFAQYGSVTSAQVITDKMSGRSKGFGFVEFSSETEANAAVDGMNGKEMDGRRLNVSIARPKEDKPQRRSY